jgi:hypothetical protein
MAFATWEILDYAEHAGLSETELEALAAEIRAASELPPEASLTAMRIALAKYPQTREMVGRLARDPDTGTTRGEWLSRSDWIQLDTTWESEVDESVIDRVVAGFVPAFGLTEAELKAAVRRLRSEGLNEREIYYRLDLSPSTYEQIKRLIEDESTTEGSDGTER